MTVICINNEGIETNLTLNKQYEMIFYTKSDTSICVINDRGHQLWYKEERFISIEEHRDNQLSKLNIL